MTKTNTTAADTFKSEEMGYIGTIADDIYFNNIMTRKHTKDTDFKIDKLDKLPQVDIIYGYQNDGSYLFEVAVKSGAQGIIFAGPETAQCLMRRKRRRKVGQKRAGGRPLHKDGKRNGNT